MHNNTIHDLLFDMIAYLLLDLSIQSYMQKTMVTSNEGRGGANYKSGTRDIHQAVPDGQDRVTVL
jgi:hypothetical protein